MKKIVFLLSIVLLSNLYPQETGLRSSDQVRPASVQQADTISLTLESAIQIALENNKDILISREDTKKADAQVSEAYGNAYPNLEFAGNYTHNFELPSFVIMGQTIKIGSPHVYSGGLSLSQVLFSAKVNTAIKVAKEYKKYTSFNAQAVKEDVVLQVKQAFYAALLTKRLVEVSNEGLRLATANYENLQKLFGQGLVSEFDLLRAEVQVANTRPAVGQAENASVLAENGLRNLLGISLDRGIKLVGDLQLETLASDIIETESGKALQRNSTLLGLLEYENILERNIQIQKADYYPTLAAFGNLQYQANESGFTLFSQDWQRSIQAGVQLSVPIFNGMQTKYRVQQAVIDKQKAVLNRQKLEEGLKIQVEEARLRMDEARARVEAQAKSVEQAEKAQAISEVRFKSGIGTQLELIDTQVALTTTRINKAQAIYDYLIARADWERVSGYGK